MDCRSPPQECNHKFFEGNMLNVQYSFDSVIKVNIYDDLYINFSDIDELLNA